MKYLELTKQFIKSKADEKGKKIDHLQNTLHWVKQLDPQADEALQIAAFAHDVSRLVLGVDISELKENKKGFLDVEHMREHQEKGAEIITKYLLEKGADKEFVSDVGQLISFHEVGGTPRADILKDADSISFFETNAEDFIKKFVPLVGKEKVEDKITWMFARISLDKARDIVRDMYKECIKKCRK
ncbi:DUF4202 family protein [Candidatus Dojkabacteria bacterium]|nr:DUF4202 family protein [Candidatus Dojkabacteria bacterium]